MGLQRTPPKAAVAVPTLLPRPEPTEYPDGVEPPARSTVNAAANEEESFIEEDEIPKQAPIIQVNSETIEDVDAQPHDIENVAVSGSQQAGQKRSLEVDDEVEIQGSSSSVRASKRHSTRGGSSSSSQQRAEAVPEDRVETSTRRPSQAHTDPPKIYTPPLVTEADMEDVRSARTRRQSLVADAGTGLGSSRKLQEDQDPFVEDPEESARRAQGAVTAAAEGENAEEQTQEDFGAHYTSLMKALEVAIRKGANRWTAKDFKGAFPKLCTKENEHIFEDIWAKTSEAFRETIMNGATDLIEHYKVARSLSTLHRVIRQARLDAENGVYRRDAWRADLTPDIRMTASNLPRFDIVYGRLREEYIELLESSQALHSSIAQKLDRCKEIETDVKESVQQLEKTVKILYNFPTPEMLERMPDIASNLEGIRKP